MEKNMSYLDIMKEADAFPYEDTEPEAYHALTMTLYKLVWKDNNGPVLGYMLASTVNRLLAVDNLITYTYTLRVRGGMTWLDNCLLCLAQLAHGGLHEFRRPGRPRFCAGLPGLAEHLSCDLYPTNMS
ncbi:hypothetical protein NUW58_g9893 [Xylaria curta]|uniref:Uncharacterized protein n=1 Tax=Xylaria curta TaxID=42375 RepID=A0ACC1MT62_9PEZI|nr:hypothetical protein NUW58_g9893 [Xylaria curta]